MGKEYRRKMVIRITTIEILEVIQILGWGMGGVFPIINCRRKTDVYERLHKGIETTS